MNEVEIWTYKLLYHNGGIQFRILAQINRNIKSYGNTLGNILLNVKNAKDNITKDNKTKDNETKYNKAKDNKAKNNKTKDNKAKNNKTKDNKAKKNKKKDHDPYISFLVNIVDNMNISQEKKDRIKTLTLKYIDSDDIIEKNKSINILEKYSKDEECKEHMDNYLMYLLMQHDIKYLKRDNFWNKIGSVAITILLIILLIVIISLTASSGAELLVYILPLFLIPIIYIFARFFPEIKLRFKKLKENYTNFIKNKRK
ncbi:Pfmc-2TM Maurer's cleft two transmembrane, putative [Plasmodium sp.]|nr:Pfmc-2TM Maurer's cleft two transmembrane, putative [Plasmodium sp.]